MILDENAAKVFAQNAANLSNTPQGIYQREDSSYIITHPNNLIEIRNSLKPNEKITLIELIQPER